MTTITPQTAPPNGSGTNGPGGSPSWTPVKVEANHLRAGWRTAAYDRLVQLCVDARGTTEGVDRARAELDEAARSFVDSTARSWRKGVAEARVTAHLDAAEGLLVPTDAPMRDAMASTVVVRVKRRFRASDTRRAQALALLKVDPTRAEVQAALDLLHRGSVDLRSNQVARREAAMYATIVFTVASIGLAVASSRYGLLSLAAPVDPAAAPRPTGTAAPAVAQAWQVLAMGAAGGLLSVLPMLLRVGVARAGAATIIQALLKVSAGAFVALIAAAAVQRGVLDLVDPLDADSLVVWAAVFGLSQSVVTKRLDSLISASKPPITPATTAADEDDGGT